MSFDAIDLSDPDTYTDGIPHEVFRWLRANDPVSWRPDVDRNGYWAVTRHADVVAVLRDTATFSAWRAGVRFEDPPPAFLEKLREGMLNRDPPDHTALRRLVNKAFSPRRIAELEQQIADQARRLVDRIRSREHCDFANEVAGELPLFVICEILGVPAEDRRMLFALTERMFQTSIKDRAEALSDRVAAAAEMRAYGAELGLKRRQHLGDDLVSDLLQAEVDGRALTDGEFQAFFMLLFSAGSDTTRALLCHGLHLLLTHPEAQAELREDPAGMPAAVEEMLRFETPVIQFRRTATRDVELAGRRISEGDKVVVYFPSANRDEAIFDTPDRFDIRRSPNPHLAFGFGAHFCLGAPLARMEAQHVLTAMLGELTDIEPCAPLETARTNFVRGVDRFEIRFKSRTAPT